MWGWCPPTCYQALDPCFLLSAPLLHPQPGQGSTGACSSWRRRPTPNKGQGASPSTCRLVLGRTKPSACPMLGPCAPPSPA